MRRLLPALLLLLLLPLPLARAAPHPQYTAYAAIEGAPLRILVGPGGNVQVYHAAYTNPATFGEAGSGFYLRPTAGELTYGAYFTHFEAQGQEGPTGAGTRLSPYRVTTWARIPASGPPLEFVQEVSYVDGEQYFSLEWQVTNTGPEQVCFSAYHAADLYFADDDFGRGFFDPATGAVGGYNEARDWFMAFIPTTPAAHYEEARYTTIWQRVEQGQDLQDTVDPDRIDNGAALQWQACLAPGRSLTLGDLWSFGDTQAVVTRPAQDLSAGGGLRPAGPLVPRLTTRIPTPLDLSLDPQVVGTNLFLALVAMVLFTVASEVLNRSLAANEPALQRLLAPFRGLRPALGKLDLSRRLGRPAWLEWVKLAAVVLLYGLVFSFLEPGWNPLSLQGVALFLSMTLAYGLVGLADDLAQWLAARRMKMAAALHVRPGNLALILASTLFSRLFGLLPGIMFGAPEAFELDGSGAPGRETPGRLHFLAAFVLLALALLAWLPTVLTALLRASSAPQFLLVLTGGLEAFLLLLFAVSVQNIFLQMLALPGTFGRALARRSKVLWGLGFLLASFAFLHTLLNPGGDIAEAAASHNVLFFLATIGLFLLFALLAWLYFFTLHQLERRPSLQARQTLLAWLLLLAFSLPCLCLLAALIAAALLLPGLG